MTGIRIDGRAVADSAKIWIRRSIEKLKQQNIEPCLATILVGEDPASIRYVSNKHKACAEVGILTKDHRFGRDVAQEQIVHTIEELNQDAHVHGILLQLPLPDHLDAFDATSRISQYKDVDGLTPQNAGLLSLGRAGLTPCTPLAIMNILDHYRIDPAGKTVVLINRSNLIGKPLHQLLLQRDATVISCHSKTPDLERFTMLADIIVTAVGNRDAFELRPDMVKRDSTIIDAAITTHKGRLAGDVAYEEMLAKASHVTPVPGGVGPMTVIMLLRNTVAAAAGIGGIEL